MVEKQKGIVKKVAQDYEDVTNGPKTEIPKISLKFSGKPTPGRRGRRCTVYFTLRHETAFAGPVLWMVSKNRAVSTLPFALPLICFFPCQFVWVEKSNRHR